jgi:hypothetical protein
MLCVAGAFAAPDANDDLLAASRQGDLQTVKALIDKGASIEATTAYGQTPLYLAAMSGHAELVRYLLDKGAKTDVRDSFYKASMLDFTVQRKHYAVAKLLVQKGAGNPDDNLRLAVSVSNADLVQAVLEKGKLGQEALDGSYEMALTGKQTAIAEMLKKAGAHEPAPAPELDSKVLESYTGTYKSEQLPLDIKVLVKDGKLFLQAAGQPEFAPKPKSATLFEFAPAQLQVEFGSADRFVLKQRGQNYVYRKAVTP